MVSEDTIKMSDCYSTSILTKNYDKLILFSTSSFLFYLPEVQRGCVSRRSVESKWELLCLEQTNWKLNSWKFRFEERFWSCQDWKQDFFLVHLEAFSACWSESFGSHALQNEQQWRFSTFPLHILGIWCTLHLNLLSYPCIATWEWKYMDFQWLSPENIPKSRLLLYI